MKLINQLRNAKNKYEDKYPIKEKDLYFRYILIDVDFFNRMCLEEGLNAYKINSFEGYKLNKIINLCCPMGKINFIMPLTKWR